ncbi:conserved hypothetical protein [Talaromyces stipitatus ATCC 10500]|uniref:Glutamyl-tRNA amidotransferase complex subunit Gta3 domain-containing protein n=1 Tax=Talaromyces stipitatus (strain ATCC 10500 / CBS 375.48 / QM 6759 / NRRL 1006) TaxID=441959 RepID=B8ML23_TALSN|nr:uncharacterized protein TSTA_048790 [Talaromyces stipitatus ATCC 10500]EED15439.1 conserved hypothetical protein [Talaromyces stipitatus ATCC 10500]
MDSGVWSDCNRAMLGYAVLKVDEYESEEHCTCTKALQDMTTLTPTPKSRWKMIGQLPRDLVQIKSPEQQLVSCRNCKEVCSILVVALQFVSLRSYILFYHNPISMPRIQLRLGHLRSTRRLFTPGRQYSSQPPKHTSKDIAALLAKPTWSVRSLLPNTHDPTIPLSITPHKLHHLLRLSALPQPADKAEETSMLRTLEAQIHFVKSIQDVDTKNVSPLRAIRDESREAIKESTISMEALKEALAKEEVVGRRKKIQRQTTTLENEYPSHAESDQWDGNALGSASRTAGRFFVVQSRS